MVDCKGAKVGEGDRGGGGGGWCECEHPLTSLSGTTTDRSHSRMMRMFT